MPNTEKKKKKEQNLKKIKIIIIINKNVSLAAVYAVTRIRTWVVAATTRSTNHYTITARTLTVIAWYHVDKYTR